MTVHRPSNPGSEAAARPAANSGRTGLTASIAIAIAAFGVFLLLPQRTFHGFDSDWYTMLVQGDDSRPLRQHVAFLPLAWLVFHTVHPLGIGAYQSLLLTSAIGSAVGVFCLHRAGRLLLACESGAMALAVAVALTPTYFYFATAAEIHGVFAAGSGAAWWAFARWRSEPRLARAAATGVVCGLASSIHSFGHVMMPTFAVIALTQGWLPRSRRIVHIAAFALAHLAVAFAVPMALGAGATGQTSTAMKHLAAWLATSDFALAPATLWREAVVPFLPWSLLALCGLLHVRARSWSTAFVLGVVLHAPIVLLLLCRPGPDFHENGGYLLPMAVPAVLAAITLLPRRVFWLATLATAGFSAALVIPRWPPAYRPEFVAAVEQLRTERTFALLVGPAELEGVRTNLEGQFCVEVIRSLASYFAAAPDQRIPVAQWFDAMVDVVGMQAGPMCVTLEAQRCFEDYPEESVRVLWRDHVQRAYDLEPVQRPGLRGVFLRRR